jgi:hypothetical protein
MPLMAASRSLRDSPSRASDQSESFIEWFGQPYVSGKLGRVAENNFQHKSDQGGRYYV